MDRIESFEIAQNYKNDVQISSGHVPGLLNIIDKIVKSTVDWVNSIKHSHCMNTIFFEPLNAILTKEEG